MKRIFLILTFLCCTSAFLFGQQGYWDVIELHDGKIFRGNIIEMTPKNGVRILADDKEVYFFKAEQVKEISKVKMKKSEMKNTDSSPVSSGKSSPKMPQEPRNEYENSGYFAIIESGLLFSLIQDGKPVNDSLRQNAILLNTIQGWHITPNFSVGIGIGAAFQQPTNTFPLSLDFRSHFTSGRIKPFVYAASGIALIIDDTDKLGSIFGDFGLGVKTSFSPSFAFNTSLSYTPYFYALQKGGGSSLKDGYFSIRAGLAF